MLLKLLKDEAAGILYEKLFQCRFDPDGGKVMLIKSIVQCRPTEWHIFFCWFKKYTHSEKLLNEAAPVFLVLQ